MDNEQYEDGIPPRIWATKFQGVSLDEWPELWALIPETSKPLVRSHIKNTLERKFVPAAKIGKCLRILSTVATVIEQPVQTPLDEKGRGGDDDDGTRESLQTGAGLPGESSNEGAGSKDVHQASEVDNDLASTRQAKKRRVKPVENPGGLAEQDSLF